MWTHFDNGSCPGQIVGVRTRLENGINGFILTKMISDKHIKSPQERVKVDSPSVCWLSSSMFTNLCHSVHLASSFCFLSSVICKLNTHVSSMEFVGIELVGIECGLLSRVSKKCVSTKWRIYKDNWTRPKTWKSKTVFCFEIDKNLSSSQRNLLDNFLL